MSLIVSLAVIGFVIFVGVKVIPVRVNAYEFRDFVRNQARFASQAENSAIRKSISDKAQELGIPLDKKNLKVSRSTNEVHISASFEQPIDLKLTTYIYKFTADEKAPLF